MMLVDAHAHFDMYRADDLPAALAEVEQHRIWTICVTMDPASYAHARQIAADSPWLLPIFGVHPWNGAAWADRLDELAGLVAESPMLGEIGLDHRWVKDASTYPQQRQTFEFFLRAAKEQGKIINLHTKGAEQEVLDLLREYDLRRVIIHWYSGPLKVLDRLIAHGVYFTVGVECLRSDKIRKIARRIPQAQLLTETDNPGGWELFNKGEWGMPHLVSTIVDELAVQRGTTRDDITAAVQANMLRLIGDDPRLANASTHLRSEP
jgi:TatD DNase family protein